MNKVSPKVLALLATLTLVWGTNWPMFAIALRELPVATFRTFVLIAASSCSTSSCACAANRFAVPAGTLAAS